MGGLFNMAMESESTVETYIDDEPAADEPAGQDTLGRARHVAALAHMARTCSTPMVIGIYGGWGVGKTSLMKQISKRLSNKDDKKNHNILTVEFEAWQHQYDDNPVAALLQTMLVRFNRESDDNFKNCIKTAIRALMPELTVRAKLNAWFAGVDANAKLNNINNIHAIHAQVLEENFQARSDRIRLKDEISKLIKEVSEGGKYRIVCFIDDLDRCTPDIAVNMLDALKIYLNIKECVFVLGLDYDRIERAILEKRQDPDYLDKIIQNYWSIPPIDQTYAYAFATSLVSRSGRRPETQECIPVIASTFGDNPRAMKRFINQLVINRNIADSLSDLFMKDYDERITCALLLLRERNEQLFKRILMSTAPFTIIEDLMRKEPLYVKKNIEEYGVDAQLLGFIQKLHLRGREDKLRNYIVLSSGLTLQTPPPEVREVEVLPGSFERKWGDYKKEFHQTVKIPYSIYVGKYPVTYQEYEIFTKDTNYKQPDSKGCEGWDQTECPVVGVTWNDAITYVQWLSKKVNKSYRLLSEAEWEYCCRAGTKTDYSVGDNINPSMANYDNRIGHSTRVGAYDPNGFGLYDMHGNVWEWVQDVWHDNYSDAPIDGSAWVEGGDQNRRVVRGGSWAKKAAELKSSNRYAPPADDCASDISFRICRPAVEAKGIAES